jgi:hypothetical protein
MVYPFLPGDYDAMAMALSTTVQSIGMLGLLLVPIGVLWLIYEIRKQSKRKSGLPNTNRGFSFAQASLIAASLVTILVSLLALLSGGLSFGVLTFALGLYGISRSMPGLRRLRTAEPESINAAALYLIFLPIFLLSIQIMLSAPATEFSRNRAITNSNEFIRDIEAYRDTYGHYPVSLAAMWKDYYPDVVGIEKFHYSPFGESYNLFFEQPRFLLDNLGTREWVVYNPKDEHRMFSHTAWFLLLTPEQLERSQGWYEVHNASTPHWKYFWFD